MIKTLNINTNEIKEISIKELRDHLWWEWCWDWMEASADNPSITIDEFRANQWHSLALEYELLQERIQRHFIKIYYPDWEYEDCYSIGKDCSWKVSPSGPLDIGEWTYYWNINDMRTALRHKIPKDIVLEWYDRHQEDYTNEETYWKVNLYHYRRKNYDKEKYEQERKDNIERSRQRMLETSYLLDEAMWVEKGTSYKAIRGNIDLYTNWNLW